MSDSCLSIHQYGSSARTMSPGSCHLMSQHLCVSGISKRSMSSGSCLSIFLSQDPLQDPCLRFMSQRPPIWIVCKIHVSGPMPQLPYVSQAPLQDPCLRIHVSASLYLTDSRQDPCLRILVAASLYLRVLCKIQVSGSMCPIHVLAS